MRFAEIRAIKVNVHPHAQRAAGFHILPTPPPLSREVPDDKSEKESAAAARGQWPWKGRGWMSIRGWRSFCQREASARERHSMTGRSTLAAND